MRILADENIPRTTIQSFEEMGHEVIDFRATAQKGAKDALVWETA